MPDLSGGQQAVLTKWLRDGVDSRDILRYLLSKGMMREDVTNVLHAEAAKSAGAPKPATEALPNSDA